MLSDPLPSQLQLSHYEESRATLRNRILGAASAYAMIAMLPVLFGGMALLKIGASKAFALYAMAAAMIALMVRAGWNEYHSTIDARSSRKWIDFESRTWHSHRVYVSRRHPEQTVVIPLDELALYIRTQHGEDSTSYGVALGKINDLRFPELGEPDALHIAGWFDEASAAHEFASALALRWGIKHWVRD